jgi:uncharacterized protein YdeI (YjbR/CyaY-like superfamily)
MPKAAKLAPELETIAFEHHAAWDAWLAQHHAAKPGVWIRFAKKASGLQTVTYQEALDVALCYGWIDGLKKGESETTFIQKFVPRTKKSIWSKINRAKALALIKSGRMQPAGHEAVASAKRDRRWHAAYDSPSKATVPKDLQAALDRNRHAKAFFATLNSQNRYAILFRLQTAANPELRKKRLQQFVAMLASHEKLHP